MEEPGFELGLQVGFTQVGRRIGVRVESDAAQGKQETKPQEFTAISSEAVQMVPCTVRGSVEKAVWGSQRGQVHLRFVEVQLPQNL